MQKITFPILTAKEFNTELHNLQEFLYLTAADPVSLMVERMNIIDEAAKTIETLKPSR